MQTTAGTLLYDNAVAATGSRSLLATVAPGAAYRRLFLAKSVSAGLTTELRASAALRVEAREVGTSNDVLDVFTTPPPGYSSYDVWVIAGGDGTLTLKGGAVPTAGAASYPSTSVAGVTLAAWTRVELVLSFEAAKVSAALSVDGTPRAQIALPKIAPGALRVLVGAPETGGQTKQGWKIRTDDVAIDWR